MLNNKNYLLIIHIILLTLLTSLASAVCDAPICFSLKNLSSSGGTGTMDIYMESQPGCTYLDNGSKVFGTGITEAACCGDCLEGFPNNLCTLDVCVGGANDDTAGIAFGTAVDVTDSGTGAVEDVLVSPVSTAVTISGTPADDDYTFFQVYRNASAVGDTFTGDVRLLGIKLFYTTDAANDA